jgi:bifunctional non-homologous end joining protein LigD
VALTTYRRKRNFKSTSEPRGKRPTAKAGNSYLIQKHAARRLHYDLRLELDGVLKSWAVTRGPSLVVGEKRLAVQVEDHPVEYGEFEGTIPKGEYGGGTVLLWDRGSWTPVGDAHEGLAKGHLEFELHGEKLRGRWHLVKIHGKPREKRQNWLLIKAEDEAARAAGAGDVLAEQPASVTSGRVIEQIAGAAPGWSAKTGKIEHQPIPPQTAPADIDLAKLKGATRAPLPSFVEPSLATLVRKAPAGKRWIHEIKFDGYRIQARIDAGKIVLQTRSGLDWTAKFGNDLMAAFLALPVGSALVDGELVVENASGASDFSALQAALSEGRTGGFGFYAFDLLHLDGYDLRQVPLIRRKELLRRIIPDVPGILRFSEHFDQNGDVILRHACRLSLEGLVSKLRDGPYHSGRGKDWVKSKCSERQEFVVAGFVRSTTSPYAVGSLVLGFYEGEELRHVGRVGTGFSAAVARSLYATLDRLRVADSPFADRLTADEARQVRYVQPTLVAEVEFRGWTADHRLRHASFRGLREDKPAREIVREETTDIKPARPGRSLKLTHPDRLYWPDVGVTKEELADYCADVWRWLAPFIVARPLSLVRCPSGIQGECFFQKHAWQGLSKAIRVGPDPLAGSKGQLLTIDDLDGVVGLVQAGVLEIHPWGAALATLEQPDQLIFDLDPDAKVGWAAVIAAAREVRDRLHDLGLPAFVKISGGKGLHVVAPLTPRAGWGDVKTFAKQLADAMAADSPGDFVSTATKAKRRGKIFVDYLRNARGATAVAPYSSRARAGAPVSMPLGWAELGEGLGPAHFTVVNAMTRLANLQVDPWGDFRRAAVPLPSAADRKRRSA